MSFTTLDLPEPLFTLELPISWDEAEAKAFSTELAQAYDLPYKGWLGIESFYGNNGKLIVLWKSAEPSCDYLIRYYQR